ncbi:GIY-YIG nuclease family protein [Romboutsia lituseburensis]|uniref:GIY-YIG nuclease family protein n=1 Tax=Romboutsia lituseburensis TaxID=1537 RepID=UPI0022EB1AEE|nr:GIY-YIG nuclease family protein [Romboutsia lituseburensis]
MDVIKLKYENKPGIYKIENIKNGKVYVGSTQNIRIRRNSHFSDLRNNRHKNAQLQNSFNKYGEKYFKFEVIEYIEDIDKLLEIEGIWIIKLNATDRKYGYNQKVYVPTSRGFKLRGEVRAKISELKKGKKMKQYVFGEGMREYKSELCKLQKLRQYHTEEIERKRKENAAKANRERGCPEWQRKSISEKNSGEGNGMSKLKENQVKEIKVLLKNGELSQQKIADMFGVSRRTIGFIKNGKRWGHIKV